MKTRPTLIITCLALAFLMIVGATRAEAQCCWGDYVAAPFVAAGAIVEGAVMVSAAIVTAPLRALSCGACGVTLCNPCRSPRVTSAPS
jgi:hypothetical protein